MFTEFNLAYIFEPPMTTVISLYNGIVYVLCIYIAVAEYLMSDKSHKTATPFMCTRERFALS